MTHPLITAGIWNLNVLWDWLSRNPAAALAVLGLIFGFPSWVLARNATLYASFDALYQQVLQLAVTYGHLRDPAKTQNYSTLPAGEKAAYEAYAYMVFNVCETIADGLDFYGRRKNPLMDGMERLVLFLLPIMADRKFLQATWRPTLIAEKQLHRTWLGDQTAGVRFKKEFLAFMDKI
jgi:hypothetical protein